MALIKLGGGIVGISGSIAGNTFARNRYGNYVRCRTKPINPKTTRQQLVRSSLAILSYRWSQILTGVQRTAWNLYGSSVSMKNRLGESIFLTGYNHYIRSNMFLTIRGETIVDAGPTVFELPEQDPTITVAPQMHEQRCAITFDDTMEWCDEVGAFLIIREGSPQNAQRNFFAGPFLGYKDKAGKAAEPYTSPENITNLHVLTTGQKVWYEFRIIRADGRLSQPWTANAVVIAGS